MYKEIKIQMLKATFNSVEIYFTSEGRSDNLSATRMIAYYTVSS